jgi:hypothetical protein
VQVEFVENNHYIGRSNVRELGHQLLKTGNYEVERLISGAASA